MGATSRRCVLRSPDTDAASSPFSMITTSQLALRPNRSPIAKPLEDFALADDQQSIYIVCDGVTRSRVNGVYPKDSPAAHASRLFGEAAAGVLADVTSAVSAIESLRMAVAAGNEAVRRYNAMSISLPDYLENDLAGTVAIIGVVRDEMLHYAYNGDCCAYLVSPDGVRRLTVSQTASVSEYRQTANGVEDHTLIIRRDFRNNKQSPYGYGVFTGEARALEWVEYRRLPLAAGHIVTLTTDGLVPYLDRCPKRLAECKPDEMINEAEQLEMKLGWRSDDKALILIRVS